MAGLEMAVDKMNPRTSRAIVLEKRLLLFMNGAPFTSPEEINHEHKITSLIKFWISKRLSPTVFPEK